MSGARTGAARPGGRPAFGLLDPLPAGRLSIEASAGTGKTFTLTALATRFIAEEGVDASELLMVTFTKAATAELRARLRGRLVEAAGALRGAAAGAMPTDPLMAHLAASDRALRLSRLERAITEFDAATITTIHGFAAQVLGLVGAAAGTDPQAILVDDTVNLVDEVCADVLATAATEGHAAGCLPDYDELRRAVGVAVRSPDLLILPLPGQEDARPADRLRAELVSRALAGVSARRTRSATLGFDDLLAEVRRALRGTGGEAAVQAVRGRYRVALVDEFQDTDPAQWDILSALFAVPDAPSGTLVLVGDPKQAIYAFRGADIQTYLRALDGADRRSSLVTNWRADGAALRALDLLLEGISFGDEHISSSPVQPAEPHRERRLAHGDGRPLPALHLRLAIGEDLPRGKKRPHDIPTADAERAVMSDLVAQARALLDDAWIPAGAGPPAPEPAAPNGLEPAASPARRVRPSDLAVLVRSSREAALAHAALLEAGIPAVQARGGSVMASPAVEQWRWLLEALVRPSDPGRARLFALSWFAGRSADWVAVAGDRELGEIQDLLHSWNETLAACGAGELVRRVWADSGVVARVLVRPDGDRDLTDLGHIGEILQAGPGRPASVAGLLARLDLELPADADAEVEADVSARRIESEAEAVRIMTVWVAKGLEFPITLCPTLWRRPPETPVIYHDAGLDRRVYDVSGAKGDRVTEATAERAEQAGAEAFGENLRLLYVALTRARHQTVVWWAPTQGSQTTALARVLFARRAGEPEQDVDARPLCPPSDPRGALEVLAPLLERAAGDIVAAVCGRPTRRPAPWADPEPPPPPAELALARLGRVPDRSAHRWSFTAITARANLDYTEPHGPDPHDGPDPDQGRGEQSDEPAGDDPYPVSPPPVTLAGTGLALLPSGPGFGTVVHAVLEATDFASEDLTESLHTSIDRVLPWHGLDLTPLGGSAASPVEGPRLLAEGLEAALETPLGPHLGGRRLRDFPPADRINEMSFELHLGEGGTVPTDADVGRLVLRHLPPGHAFRSWAESLAGGLFDTVLAGHLTGSVDTVLRVRDGAERFVVVDYKTNRLHPPGCVPTAADYAPDRMVEAMVQHSYPLQALLYLVALHRYLRWRLPGYRPASHLGGVAYLFLRGMAGEGTPTTDDTVHGVYTWAVPPGLVVELSDLLAGCPDAVCASESLDGAVGGRGRAAARAAAAQRPRRSGRARNRAPAQLSFLPDGAVPGDPGAGDPAFAIPSRVAAAGEPASAIPCEVAAARERR